MARKLTQLTEVTAGDIGENALFYLVDPDRTAGDRSVGMTDDEVAALVGSSPTSSNPIENEYVDNAAMFADQGNQTTSFFQYVTGADNYYEKLSTNTASISDYRLLSDTETVVLRGNNSYNVLRLSDIQDDATPITSINGGRIGIEYDNGTDAVTGVFFNELFTDAIADIVALGTGNNLVLYNQDTGKYHVAEITAYSTVNTDYTLATLAVGMDRTEFSTNDRLRVFIDIGGAGGGGSSPLTTKGDIYTYDTADARLPIGTDGQILSADSAETTGLKWIAAAGGATPTLQQVTTQGDTTTDNVTVNGLIVDDTLGDLTLDLRDVAGIFASQPYFGSNLGYTVFKPSSATTGSRFYIMPNGSTGGLTSKFELFNTDYEADDANYNGFNIYCKDNTNEILIGPNQDGTAARLKMTIASDFEGSILQPNSATIVFDTTDDITITSNDFTIDADAIIIEEVPITSTTNINLNPTSSVNINVPSGDEQSWTVFDPLHLGQSMVLAGRSNAATSEFLNNAYFDGSWKRIRAGYSHRFTFGSDGFTTSFTGGTGAADSAITWTANMEIKPNGTISMERLSTYANDGAAGTGGLDAGDLYKTSTGEVRIKL